MKFQKKMTEDELKCARPFARKGFVSYPSKEVKQILRSSKSYLIIAEYKENPIGCGFVRIEKVREGWFKHEKAGYLGMLYVDKKFRRKGVGVALQNERIKWLKSKKIKMVFNKILVNNKPSIKMKEKHGFKPYILAMYKEIK